MLSLVVYCISTIILISLPSQSSYSCTPSPQCSTDTNLITCNSGTCSITCDDTTCAQWIILCNYDTICDITCNGPQSCHGTSFYADYAQTLSINIDQSNSNQALYLAQIFCPNDGPERSHSCQIRSNDATGNSHFQSMVVNAVEGFKDVTIYCESSTCNMGSAQMQCTADYSYSCIMVGSTQVMDACQSGPTHCESYALTPSTNPSNYPTKNPSLSPTNNPTLVPTKNPSISPINNPTVAPTNNPHPIPTQSPTYVPTHTPSHIPTDTPTDIPSQRTTTVSPTTHPIDNNHGEISETTETTKYIKIENGNGTKKSHNVFWIVIGVLLPIVIICILCAVFIIIHKIKKEQAIQPKQVMIPSHSVVTLHNIGDGPKNESIQDTNSNPSHLRKDHFIIDDDNEEHIHVHATLGAPQNILQIDNVIPVIVPGSIQSSIQSDFNGTREHKSGVNTYNNSNKVIQNSFTHMNHFDMLKQEELNKIKTWLIRHRMDIYFRTFVSNGYDSMDIIKAIETKAELNEIGITLKGHQTKLLAEIKKLKRMDLQNENDIVIVYKNSNEMEVKDDDHTPTEEGTNEDITDPPTEEGDTPNDDTGSSDINNTQGQFDDNTQGQFDDNTQGNDIE